MKPKAALTRVAIVGDAPKAPPITKQYNSPWPSGRLTLLPPPGTTQLVYPRVSPDTDSIPQSWFRKHNSRGQVVEEGLCLGKDIPVFRWIYTYGITGARVQAVLLNAGHCLLEKRLYDDAGQLTRKIILAADGTAEQTDYKNDGKRNSNGGPGLRKDLPKAA